ncbi:MULTISPECIES: HNH endonuclease [Acinetobacter]|nr:MULTISPECIES: HNH endonuclease [Acinetobacter]MCU4363319.1 HNH endonuclease [Acinetobacter sp. WU_MDCI_Abxc22]MDC5120198.1 HNH endonuclease [Acinetobacter baumannii]MDH2528314.1 HNH endonuclease [Acinetobacter baumannii]
MNRPNDHRTAQKKRKIQDFYMCQLCGSDKNVQAHHIFEYGKGGPSTLEGMISLCLDCHQRMIHRDSRITIVKKENRITTFGKGGK